MQRILLEWELRYNIVWKFKISPQIVELVQ